MDATGGGDDDANVIAAVILYFVVYLHMRNCLQWNL